MGGWVGQWVGGWRYLERLKSMEAAASLRFWAVEVSMLPRVGALSSMKACRPMRMVDTLFVGEWVGGWVGESISA